MARKKKLSKTKTHSREFIKGFLHCLLIGCAIVALLVSIDQRSDDDIPAPTSVLEMPKKDLIPLPEPPLLPPAPVQQVQVPTRHVIPKMHHFEGICTCYPEGSRMFRRFCV